MVLREPGLGPKKDCPARAGRPSRSTSTTSAAQRFSHHQRPPPRRSQTAQRDHDQVGEGVDGLRAHHGRARASHGRPKIWYGSGAERPIVYQDGARYAGPRPSRPHGRHGRGSCRHVLRAHQAGRPRSGMIAGESRAGAPARNGLSVRWAAVSCSADHDDQRASRAMRASAATAFAGPGVGSAARAKARAPGRSRMSQPPWRLGPEPWCSAGADAGPQAARRGTGPRSSPGWKEVVVEPQPAPQARANVAVQETVVLVDGHGRTLLQNILAFWRPRGAALHDVDG